MTKVVQVFVAQNYLILVHILMQVLGIKPESACTSNTKGHHVTLCSLRHICLARHISFFCYIVTLICCVYKSPQGHLQYHVHPFFLPLELTNEQIVPGILYIYLCFSLYRQTTPRSRGVINWGSTFFTSFKIFPSWSRVTRTCYQLPNDKITYWCRCKLGYVSNKQSCK